LLGRRYLFSVAGQRVSSYVALLYAGSVLGVFAGAAAAGEAGLNPGAAALGTTLLLVPALIGARLLFVLQHAEIFRSSPGRIWDRPSGGSSLYGGLIAALAVSLPLLPLLRLPFWRYWDAASVSMLVGLLVARFGCLLHGCCGGRATASRLGLWLPDHAGVWRRRFPTQLLESGWASLILAGTQAVQAGLRPGGRLVITVGAYGASRLVLEQLRQGNAAKWAKGWNLGLSALAVLLAGAALAAGWLR
jgi:phosphatidylglycerol---prolipoprotein diacylglyceryl transferase